MATVITKEDLAEWFAAFSRKLYDQAQSENQNDVSSALMKTSQTAEDVADEIKLGKDPYILGRSWLWKDDR